MTFTKILLLAAAAAVVAERAEPTSHFILLATQRTGSTWVMSELSKHSSCIATGTELFLDHKGFTWTQSSRARCLKMLYGSEIDKKKNEIQEKINKAAAKDEKARKALEERKRLQGEGLKKLEGELKYAQILYDRAESDLKENSDSEILKQDFQIASYNLQEAKDAIVREKEFLGVNKEPTIWDIIQNMLKMLVTDNLFKAASNMNLLPLIVFVLFLLPC